MMCLASIPSLADKQEYTRSFLLLHLLLANLLLIVQFVECFFVIAYGYLQLLFDDIFFLLRMQLLDIYYSIFLEASHLKH
jgi:hypothetical protein